ncbi:MAG: lytic transglycosylase domain-containing protein, partial [Acidobacteriia bacterium]|nr:lytic transglycosylase domain-containing protein [Terriglobia bacterium]
ADLLAGNAGAAYAYLRGLDPASPDASAERLYYLEECARRLSDDGGMMAAVRSLGELYPKSPWRLKALLSAGNRFLLVNRAEDYVPLYEAAYRDFPSEPSAGTAHWKVTFHAWLANQPGAADLLREQLRRYPTHPTAGAALYFLGRGAEQDGDFGAARTCYERLTKTFQNTYYAMQARGRLARAEVASAPLAEQTVAFLSSLALPQTGPVPAEDSRATALRIERSRLLRAAGLDDLADSELRFGARTDGQPARLAMEMAASADAPYQGVRIMKSMVPDYLGLSLDAAPRHFWELLFPLPYRSELLQSARGRGLDPYLVAGLIRQESEFNPRALSRANAYGLTQVRPATGRRFAQSAGVRRLSAGALYQPSVNLKIGSAILRSMLDEHNGKLEPTLAGYNAGPNRVTQWLAWNTYREPAEFVESIPFTETRDYVQAVLRNADVYRRLYGR